MIINGTKFDWLIDLPKEWEIHKVKNHFAIHDLQTPNYKEFPILSLTLKGIIERDKQSNEGQIPESYEEYNLVDQSCIVLNPMDLISGWIDIPKISGLISPSYKSLKLKSDSINLDYIKFYFQSLYKEKIFFNFGEGVHYEYRWGLGTDTLINFPIPVPPYEIQEKIVSDINKKVIVIDNLINLIEKKISVIEEESTTLLIETITKGLNKDISLKSTGIDWVQDIPHNWEITKIKYISKMLRGKFSHRPRNDEKMYGGIYPFIQTGDITNAGKYLNEYTQTLNELGYAVSKEFEVGTVVMAISANIGNVSILNIKSCFPDSIVGFVANQKTSPEYLYYLFSAMKEVFVKNSVKSTQLNLNIERVGSIKIPLPKINEQNKIIEFLTKKINSYQDLVIQEKKRIKLLKEYKISTISNLVRGINKK